MLLCLTTMWIGSVLIHIPDLAFLPGGRSREIYGVLLKVKQFQWEQIKDDGIKYTHSHKRERHREENNRMV